MMMDEKPPEPHEFDPFHPDWVMPRCRVCREFEDHHLHQHATAIDERERT